MPIPLKKSPTNVSLADVLAGDAKAIRQLCAECGPAMMAVIRKQLKRYGRADEAEDCLNSCFGLMFQDNGRILRMWDPEKGRSLRTYLMVLAHRRSMDFSRRRIPQTLADDEVQDILLNPHNLLHGPEEQVGWDELLERLRTQCTEDEWKIFVLCFQEERSAEDVATILSISVQAVHQRKHRLRQRLQKFFSEDGKTW